MALLVFMAGFAVLATRDHMQWQRARWEVIQGVLRQGVTASELDGGYEFNGQVRGIGFSPEGAPITHHVALVDRNSSRRPPLRHLSTVDRSSRRGDLRPSRPRGSEPTAAGPAVITRPIGTDNAINWIARGVPDRHLTRGLEPPFSLSDADG